MFRGKSAKVLTEGPLQFAGPWPVSMEEKQSEKRSGAPHCPPACSLAAVEPAILGQGVGPVELYLRTLENESINLQEVLHDLKG